MINRAVSIVVGFLLLGLVGYIVLKGIFPGLFDWEGSSWWTPGKVRLAIVVTIATIVIIGVLAYGGWRLYQTGGGVIAMRFTQITIGVFTVVAIYFGTLWFFNGWDKALDIMAGQMAEAQGAIKTSDRAETADPQHPRMHEEENAGQTTVIVDLGVLAKLYPKTLIMEGGTEYAITVGDRWCVEWDPYFDGLIDSTPIPGPDGWIDEIKVRTKEKLSSYALQLQYDRRPRGNIPCTQSSRM